MKTFARGFFVSAAIFGVLGMLLGLHMAISQDHGQMPTHAHIMVIGWLSFFAFGVFHQLFGAAVSRTLSRIHFWLAHVSLIGLIVGLLLIYSGQMQYEPIAAISSMAYAVSFLLFGLMVLGASRSDRAGG